MRKYEMADQPAHIFALAMCKVQHIKDKHTLSGKILTFVCSKKMIANKLKRMKEMEIARQKQPNYQKNQFAWRVVTNSMDATEKFALKILLRTVVFGTISTAVELVALINFVALFIFAMGGYIFRPPTLNGTPVRQRLGLVQLHHVAAYTAFPSLLIGQVVFTLGQFEPLVAAEGARLMRD